MTVLVPEGIIRPVVSVLTLTWFITYVCYLKLQFLNNVIIIKSKSLLPHAFPDFGDHVYALWFTCSQNSPEDGYSRNASCALNLISTFLLPLLLLLFCHF
jgi:hypothetical protein